MMKPCGILYYGLAHVYELELLVNNAGQQLTGIFIE